jgi:hypothetical protein
MARSENGKPTVIIRFKSNLPDASPARDKRPGGKRGNILLRSEATGGQIEHRASNIEGPFNEICPQERMTFVIGPETQAILSSDRTECPIEG